jgi:signal transduction histidine kinase
MQRYCGSFELFHMDGTPMPFEKNIMAQVIRTGIPQRNQEVIIGRPDGSRVIALVNVAPLRNERGELIGAVNCILDISARKQAEEALKNSYDQLRALSARLQSVREEEATRIAREIHDELGQSMTGLKMDLLRAERKLEELPGSPAVNSLLDTLVSATDLADGITASVQEIAADLRPGVLDKLGLGAALHYESRRFQERSGILCEARLPETELELATEVATALFRIFQECLTNVARHAGATKMEVALKLEEGWVSLRVMDNGRGITEAEIANPHSLGLLGMKERTALLGGEIAFERNPEGGTIVAARVPQNGKAFPTKAPA